MTINEKFDKRFRVITIQPGGANYFRKVNGEISHPMHIPYPSEIKQFINKEIESILDELIGEEKELIKPKEYRYLCYGGSVCTRIDSFGEDKYYNCGFKGEDNWAVPTCKECNGKLEGYLQLTDYEKHENREIEAYNQKRQEIIDYKNKLLNK